MDLKALIWNIEQYDITWDTILILNQYYGDPEEYHKIAMLENRITGFIKYHDEETVKDFIRYNNLPLTFVSHYVETQYLSDLYKLSYNDIRALVKRYPNLYHKYLYDFIQGLLEHGVYDYIEEKYYSDYVLDLASIQVMLFNSYSDQTYYDDFFDYMNNVTNCIETMIHNFLDDTGNVDIHDLYLSYVKVINNLDAYIIPKKWF